jgi:UDP-2,3-diacylglucosamine hydrolase
VLVKALKPAQDRKTDLPVIGVETVRNAASVGLAGVAIEAGRSLVINRSGVIDAANAAGVFVVAFAPEDYAG